MLLKLELKQRVFSRPFCTDQWSKKWLINQILKIPFLAVIVPEQNCSRNEGTNIEKVHIFYFSIGKAPFS